MTWTVAQHYPTHGTFYEVTCLDLAYYVLSSFSQLKYVQQL